MTATPTPGADRTIADLLAASGTGFDANTADFDMLNAALAAAGLTGAFADAAADLTLLAPTDAAFIRLAKSLGYTAGGEQGAFDAIVGALTTLGGGDPIPLLTQILRSHVVPEGLSRGEIEASTTLATLEPGVTLAPFGNRLGDGDPDAADARLLGGAEAASNGSLQAISEVILPINVPGNSDNLPPKPTIAAIAAGDNSGFDGNAADFDILAAALNATGLASALSVPEAELTVFAPTDAAFLQLARDLGFAGGDEAGAFNAIAAALTTLAGGDPIPLLTDILKYHVTTGTFSVAQADAAGPITMLAGGSIEVVGQRIVDGDPDARDARFVAGATDIAALNGAVQAIDRVLLPIDLALPDAGIGGTIADQLATSGTGFDGDRGDFDILNAALGAAGLTGALDDAALDATLFAPTDAAFLRLARDFGFTGRDEAGAFDAIVAALTTLGGGDPIPLLTTVLTYHVAPGARTAAEIAATPTLDTLAGLELHPFGRTLGDLDPTLPDAKIIGGRADLPASNGIIQAIDRVLLPADVPEAGGSVAPRGTLADLIAASGPGPDGNPHDFDILNAALRATGLDAALDDPAATLTLLAPTDAAFLRLATDLGLPPGTEEQAVTGILNLLGVLGGGNPIPVLTEILSYHVLDGRFSQDQLRAEGEVQTLLAAADPLEFAGRRIGDEEPGYVVRFEGRGDVLADNGALQAIDGVLLPLDLPLI